MNLLLQSNWQTPHNTFPFPDVSIADIEDAIKEGIRIEAEEVANIASQSTPPTCNWTNARKSYNSNV